MNNLLNSVMQHLSDDVVMQLTRQIGAQDPNSVKSAAGNIAQVLLGAVERSANNQQSGEGLFGAIKRDHDGGILGDLMGVLSGKSQVNNAKTMNGEGIISHLLGNKQLEVAQVIGQSSGLDIFKSGVLMQLIAPVIMGVVGQKQKSNGLDLGGLAQVLLGGRGQNTARSAGGGLVEKLLDRDGDGNMLDDLLNICLLYTSDAADE